MKYIFLLALCGLVSSFALAQSKSRLQNCEKPQDSNGLFWCLVKNHPSVQLSSLQRQFLDNVYDEASQRLNPELDFEYVSKASGEASLEATLMQTFELGGKRAARQQMAQVQMQESEHLYHLQLEKSAVDVAVKLHRLRQIQTEMELANENLQTFRDIQRQYKKLARLNPEQTISLSVFEIAAQETELKVSSLEQEKNAIETQFQVAIGLENWNLPQQLLPVMRSEWPKVEISEIKSANRQLLETQVQLTNAQYGLASSEAWPNLSIGPKLEQTTGNIDETAFGFALSLPLPLLNRNSGGRAKALSRLKKAELHHQLVSLKLQQEKTFLLKTYSASSQAVQRFVKATNVQKRHKNLHQLLNRGLVNSSLVIEMHREVFEFYERLHHQEIIAIDSLWKLYAMKGNLFERGI